MDQVFEFISLAVCHGVNERSVLIGDIYMPVCARCQGIYISMFISTLFLFLTTGFKCRKIPTVKSTVLLCCLLLPFMIDGGLSYLGIIETNNLRRILSGCTAGCALPYFLMIGLNYDYKNAAEQYKAGGSILIDLCLCLGVCLLSYAALIGYIVPSVFVCLGIVILFWLVSAVVIKNVSSLNSKKSIVFGLIIALAIIVVLGAMRNVIK